ncbi:HPr family phosphocarrier protein [Metabacillus halosaccharovorans]|uniref:HPr family phosphocarrier protein n=1 Tax=Metabacillus halosaccharovorans TaxID=930124 RepID=UPI0027E21F43|nr:HPr family phosphocarrier protein [Metabacillus halosaccharovorans]
MEFNKRASNASKLAQALQSGSINVKDMASIVNTANKFKSSIVLHAEEKIIDVKSFLGLSVSLMSNSTQYTLEIHGDDEEEAKEEMKKAFNGYGIKVEVN